MAFVLGIDVGSGYTKAVLCEDRQLRSYAVLPSGGNYQETVGKAADEAARKAGIAAADISRTVATGYGAAAVAFADETITDMACQAAGIHLLFPAVRTFVDIGAQYSRAVHVNDDGKVTYFVLNEKCAGGSGKFLQVMARILKVRLEEIGPLSLTSTKPVQFTTACAVFAESEAVSRISEGYAPADIVAGLHKAMASKIVTLVTRVGLEEDIAITGGGAKDQGLVAAIQQELGIKVYVPDDPQLTAALGACSYRG